jgi:hypothetical protein
MRKYPGMPELLEQFMKEEGEDERWVTVQELRDRFGLTRYQCNTVSGFLHRLQHGNFAQFPFIVIKREWAPASRISDNRVYRYLVKRRDDRPTASQDIISVNDVR